MHCVLIKISNVTKASTAVCQWGSWLQGLKCGPSISALSLLGGNWAIVHSDISRYIEIEESNLLVARYQAAARPACSSPNKM